MLPPSMVGAPLSAHPIFKQEHLSLRPPLTHNRLWPLYYNMAPLDFFTNTTSAYHYTALKEHDTSLPRYEQYSVMPANNLAAEKPPPLDTPSLEAQPVLPIQVPTMLLDHR